MANNKKKTDTTPHSSLGQEIIAVIGVLISLFLVISLASFSLPLADNMFPVNSGNWGGALGYFLSRILTGMLGISSFGLVGLLLLFSVLFFTRRASIERLPLVLLGTSGMVISLSSLIAAIGSPTVTIMGAQYPSSGLIGGTLFSVAVKFVGRPGFVLFALFLLLLSTMISLRFSLYLLSARSFDFAKKCKQRRDEKRLLGVNKISKRTKAKSSEKEPVPIYESSGQEPLLHAPVKIDTEQFTPLPVAEGEFALPPVTLLDIPPDAQKRDMPDKDHFLAVSKQLEAKLIDFGVNGKVIGISPGPVVTTYEFSPAAGIKISRVVSLENDLALGLKAESVRIVGSVPGKAALGIEIPNPVRQMVYLREILANDGFQEKNSPLTIGLGKDVVGNPIYANLADMPHLLIAGATGAGKSVGINTIICSILLKATPDEVRLLMVDPKRIELSSYEAIPHLLHPVVVDPKMASRALQWAVLEMERRYSLMEQMKVKNITTYNEAADEKLPLIVIIIDELADLMMVASKDVEGSVARLAQMARAAGMHLILATQRPSVDVLTGLIKANFPTRMSFKVSSKIDSRTILDQSGAEHLLGKGDMLFVPPGTSRLKRIHSAYVSETEIEKVVRFLREQGHAQYDESVLKIAEENELSDGMDESEYDEKYDEAVEFVCESGQASISMVQRRLRVGYNRAARMIEVMEKEGIVGPSDGAKPRKVLTRKTYP